MTSWNPDDPLARAKGESAKANQALQDYTLLGAGRSLAKLCDIYNQRRQSAGKATSAQGGINPILPPTRRLRTLQNWSSRHAWQRRVAAHQALQNAEERAKWEERRKEWRERSFDLAGKLAEKAEQMLRFPLVEKVIDDNDVTIIQPAGWSFGTIPTMVGVADKIVRLSAELDTERRRDLSWMDEIVELIREGRITREDVERELGYELAEDVFKAAGLRGGEDG